MFNGTAQQMVRPTAKDSFHLMVALADASTNYAIPYSSVWTTIRKAGKIVFDERLWPMISRYMGPHYGNNVSLPSAGLYRLTLLVSPPVAARHLEYKGLWLKPHRVTMSFNWVPRT
ncbi:MAG TPA: iron transporter [Gaiellaceae bacterium]|nr:iron transporter [Gaiellaceae bacterium]